MAKGKFQTAQGNICHLLFAICSLPFDFCYSFCFPDSPLATSYSLLTSREIIASVIWVVVAAPCSITLGLPLSRSMS